MNKVGGKNRQVKEVIHKWKDLKSRAKKDISARKNPKTGGGKQSKEGSYSELIIEIIGTDNPSLSGISGGGTETGVEVRVDDGDREKGLEGDREEGPDSPPEIGQQSTSSRRTPYRPTSSPAIVDLECPGPSSTQGIPKRSTTGTTSDYMTANL